MTLVERVTCMLSEAKLPKHFWGEALLAAVHVINLSPAVALNTEVPDKIWFGKNVSYDHLCVFGCRAFVHVPKDERSKLDKKTRQCIFIGYGEDEFGYRFYDPVEKKLVRSRDVQFMEDQTIEDIDKVKKTTPEKDSNLTDGNPMRLPTHNLENVETEAQDNEQHGDVDDQQFGSGVEVPIDDAQEEHDDDDDLGDIPESPQVQLRRSNRQKQPSTRYSCDEYITLTDGGEPECFEEAKFIAITEACKELLWLKKFLQELGFRQDNYSLFVDSQSAIHLGKNPTFHSRSKHIDVRYHWICDALDAKLLELEKVHTDDNGTNMMTKALPRGKFEVCCEIASLAVISTKL